MSVPVQCPNPDCRAFGVVAEAALGRRGRCRKCRRVFELARVRDGAGPAGEELAPTTPYQSPTPAGAGAGEDLPERFGRYRIRRRLGRGGMGAVYLARDPKLRRWVALKVPSLATSEGPRAILRFEREARAAATLDHPNLCPVFDFGVVDGVPYLTMPFIDGRPLSDRIGRGRRPAEAEAAAIVRTLALALHEAHGRGVVHRDLKPSNILFNRRGELVVVDFGLARLEDDDAAITGAGLALGTALYMAPEQAAGEDDAGRPAVDIYALGVILYELLAEVRPFDGPRSFVIALKTYRDPAPPSTHRPGLHPALDAICLRALARDPAGRFASMADFARALADFAAGPADAPPSAGPSATGPILPDPASTGPDPAPSRRRLGRPAAAGLVAGAALLLLALILPFAAPGRGRVEVSGGPGAEGSKAPGPAAPLAVEHRPEAPAAPPPPAPAPARVEPRDRPGPVGSTRDRPPPVGGIRGDWRIEGDELVQSSLALGLDAHPYLAFGDATWSEYDLTFEAKKVAGDEGFLVLFHWRDEATYGQLGLGTRENRDFDLRFYDQARSRYVIQDARPGRIEEGRWYLVRLEVRGPTCRCYLGPDLLFEKSRAERDRGRVGLATWKTAARFRGVRVTAPDGRTLFEGLPDPAARPSTSATPPDAAEAMAGRVKGVETSLFDDPPPGDPRPDAAGRPAPGPFQPLFGGGVLRETLLLRGGGAEGAARWAVEDGLLVARGPGEAAFLVQKQLRDFDLRAEVQRADGDAAGLLLLRADEKGDRPRGYSVGLGRSRDAAGREPEGADADAGAVHCRATVPANSVELGRGAPADAPPPDAWFRVEVKARGPALTVRVGDGPALTAVDPRRLFAHGLVGFAARGGGGGRPALKVRRIEVRPAP